MMRSSRPRKTANLSDSVQQQLTMYAFAAGAAGVGVLALTSPAEGKIVYTPANIRIVQNGGLIRFDLNHDGTADFGLSNLRMSRSSEPLSTLRVIPERRANQIWYKGFAGDSLCAAALPKGTKVGPNGGFRLDYPAGEVMAATGVHGSGLCPWVNVKQAYLGLKFVIKGKTQYGWARVKVSLYRSIAATLTGYAYETIPGKPIIAGATKGPDDAGPTASLNTPTPEPATLGALSKGAPGLSIWRRKESVAATPESN
jgi:hypothetical protein